MKLSIELQGMDKLLNHAILGDYTGRNIKSLVEQETGSAAQLLQVFIKQGYLSENKAPNSLVTQYVDTIHRHTNSGSPLNKNGLLANSVIVEKNGKNKFIVKINPEAQPDFSSSKKSISMEEIASLQETGYIVRASPEVKRFYASLHIQSGGVIKPPTKDIYVPARPVWGPAIEKSQEHIKNYLHDGIKSALYATGKNSWVPNRKRKYKKLKDFGMGFGVEPGIHDAGFAQKFSSKFKRFRVKG